MNRLTDRVRARLQFQRRWTFPRQMSHCRASPTQHQVFYPVVQFLFSRASDKVNSFCLIAFIDKVNFCSATSESSTTSSRPSIAPFLARRPGTQAHFGAEPLRDPGRSHAPTDRNGNVSFRGVGAAGDGLSGAGFAGDRTVRTRCHFRSFQGNTSWYFREGGSKWLQPVVLPNNWKRFWHFQNVFKNFRGRKLPGFPPLVAGLVRSLPQILTVLFLVFIANNIATNMEYIVLFNVSA